MNGRLWLVALLYLGMMISGAGRVVGTSLLQFLTGIFVAGVATSWTVADARQRRQPIVHSLQYLLLGTWPLSVPVYLVWSRGLRGLGWAVLHTFGIFVATTIGASATYALLMGLSP